MPDDPEPLVLPDVDPPVDGLELGLLELGLLELGLELLDPLDPLMEPDPVAEPEPVVELLESLPLDRPPGDADGVPVSEREQPAAAAASIASPTKTFIVVPMIVPSCPNANQV